MQTGDGAAEIKRLQRCINDLVSLFALPALWSGDEPSQIVHTLLDALLRILQLDLVYVRLAESRGQAPIEMVRFAQAHDHAAQPHEIGEALKRWLGANRHEEPPVIWRPVGGRDIALMPMGLGLQGEIGQIVAGSEREDFPRQTERLILSVAANQASIGLQRARLLREQKRVANELDRRVTQRTADLVEAYQELRRGEGFHRVVVETASDAVVSIDHKGDILLANHAATTIFGYQPAELIGQPLTMLMPAYLRDLHKAGLQRYQETSHRHINWQSTELIGLRKNGEEFPVEVSFGEIANNSRRVFTGFIRDISERKQSQEALRNAHAELAHVNRVMTMGELAASIAHEVNQPLAAIVASGDSCTAWLANEPPSLDKARAAASRIVQAATQASDVVRRIRALFRKTTSITTPLEINEVITETVSLVGGEAQRKGVSLNTDLAANLPTVLGDRIQLQQVILKLAINGTEAMSRFEAQPRRLVIQSKLAEPGEIVVSVADTGPGIDPQQTAHLFAPFYTTKPEGIGMGLSISRSIIEAHGGRLWAASNQPRGAVFHFALPVAPTA